MNVLITAGNTHAPIDRVRVLTNVFTGRTGAALARAAWARGHRVTILTSHPETLSDAAGPRLVVMPYRTFDDLAERLQDEITLSEYDAVLHAAAVSDYLCAGVFAPNKGTSFDASARHWETTGSPPAMTELRAGKIKSLEPELWLRLVQAPKLVDRVRSPWGFTGTLVKFKLEVGVTDAELLDVAERSRVYSGADLMVANTLEGAAEYAFIGPVGGRYERVARSKLPDRLLQAVEHYRRGERDG